MKETNLTNCALDFLGKSTWPSPNYTTWAHPDNTFADSKTHKPLILDHIFRRTNNPKNVKVRTTGFEVLKLKASCNSMRSEERKVKELEANSTCPSVNTTFDLLNYTQCLIPKPQNRTQSFSITLNWIQQTFDTNCDSHNMISLSDHDAVTATISIEKLGNVDIRIRN